MLQLRLVVGGQFRARLLTNQILGKSNPWQTNQMLGKYAKSNMAPYLPSICQGIFGIFVKYLPRPTTPCITLTLNHPLVSTPRLSNCCSRPPAPTPTPARQPLLYLPTRPSTYARRQYASHRSRPNKAIANPPRLPSSIHCGEAVRSAWSSRPEAAVR